MFSLILYAILSLVCIVGGFYCLWLFFKRRGREDIVYDNSSFFLMTISGIALGSLVLYLLLTGEAELAPVPAAAAFICLLGLLSWHNEVVFFDEDGFTKRDILFRSRRFRYTDIVDRSDRSLRQGPKRRETQTVFHLEKGRFSLSNKAVNYYAFDACVRKYGRSVL